MNNHNNIEEFYTNMIAFREFTFDSAHFLPNVPEGHKCKNMHGHTYRLKVFIEGDLDETYGWIMDFAELKQSVSAILDIVDHKVLNNIPGLHNPTCELLAEWLWHKIIPTVPTLKKIELNETPFSGVVYSKPVDSMVNGL